MKRKHNLGRTSRTATSRPFGVEALEARQMLSCNVTQVDDTVHIQGDDGDNRVHLQDRGNGAVRVLCRDAGGGPVTRESFDNVGHIRGELGAGDDFVKVLVHRNPNKSIVPDVEFDLGPGRDELDPHIWTLDTLAFRVDNEIDGIQQSLTIESNGSQTTARSRSSGLTFDVNVDTANVLVADVDIGTDASFNITAEGFRSYNRQLRNVSIEGQFSESVTGTEDSDRVQLISRDVSLHGDGSFSSAVSTLGGADTIRQRARFAGSSASSNLSSLIDAGVGDDTVNSLVSIEIELPSWPFTMNINGNSGNDRIRFGLIAPPELDDVFAQLDGGPGIDACQATDNIDVIGCERSLSR